MAIPKKGTRKIIVNDISYRWLIRKKPTYSQALGSKMTVAVELYNNPRSVLSITFPWMRCDNWLNYPVISVTPRDIETCIKNALRNGWHPMKLSSGFEYFHEI